MSGKENEEFSTTKWAFKVGLLVVSFVVVVFFMQTQKKEVKQKESRPHFIIPATR